MYKVRVNIIANPPCKQTESVIVYLFVKLIRLEGFYISYLCRLQVFDRCVYIRLSVESRDNSNFRMLYFDIP